LGFAKVGNFFNGDTVTLEELPRFFAAEARKEQQSEVHIRANRYLHYKVITQVMTAAAKSGLIRIGFVSIPD